MNNLYKASFNTVIYAADISEAVKFARDLIEEHRPFCLEEKTVEEVLTKDDLPCGWKVSYHPIKCGSGSFEDKKIKEILEENNATLALRQKIKELETEMVKLKKSLEDAQVKEYEKGYEAGLDAAYHSAQYRKD